jgi:hypothetical protein
MDRRVCLLWSVIAGGALLSKVQGAYIILPASALLLARAVVLGLRQRMGQRATPTPKDLAGTLGLMALGTIAVLFPQLPAEMWHSPQPALTAPNLITLIDRVPVVVTADQDQPDPLVKQALDRDFRRIPSYHEVRVFLRLQKN